MSTAPATTPVHPSDSYDRIAEFHEVFMGEPWGRLRPTIGLVLHSPRRDEHVAASVRRP